MTTQRMTTGSITNDQKKALYAAAKWDDAWNQLMAGRPRFRCPTCGESMTYNVQRNKFFHTKRGSTCRQNYATLQGDQ